MSNSKHISKIADKNTRYYFMGIAIVLVVLYHLCIFPEKYYNHTSKFLEYLFSRGDIGVDVFFFFSSLGLGFSLENSNNIKDFYIRRIVRLFPIYPLFLIITYLLIRFVGPLSIFTNDFYNQIVLKPIIGGTDNIEWYIPALCLLYFIYPIIFWLTKQTYKNVFLIIISVVLLSYGSQRAFYFITSFFTTRLPIIYLGIVTYLCIKDSKYERLLTVYGIASCVGVISVKHNLTSSFALPLVVYALSDVIHRFRFSGIFLFLGKHTLEIYLAQVIGTKLLLKVVPDYYMGIILSLLITTLLSVLLYYCQYYSQKILQK